MTHSELVQKILITYGAGPETRLWRNETGLYYISLESTQRVYAGLCKGSADIIGIHRGLFVAIEVKTGQGRVEKQQRRFLETINALDGIAGVARSVEDAREILYS